MIRLLPFLFLLFQYANSLVGDWKSYSYLNDITSLKAFQGKLYVGTTGGIRQYDPKRSTENLYNNPQEGILDIEIAGFTVTENDQLWAISKKGILYKWDNNDSWKVFNRNFSTYAGVVNDRAILSVGPYIVLGSTKGLSFFLAQPLGSDPSGIFYETFYTFGSDNDVSVTSLLRDGEILYLGTSKGVYKAHLYWENLKHPPEEFVEEHGRFLNPQIWEKVEIDSTHLANSNTIIGQLSLDGSKLIGYGPGTILNNQPTGLAVLGSPLILGNEEITGNNDMITLEVIDGQIFTGSKHGLFELKNKIYLDITNPQSLPKGQVFNVSANQNGTHIWNVDLDGNLNGPASLHQIENNTWVSKYNFTLPQIIGAFKHRLNVLYAKNENEIYIGNWGWGVEKVENNSSTFINSTNSCLEGIPNAPEYNVIRNISPHDDKGLFLTTYHVVGSFSLAYVNFEQVPGKNEFDITCFNSDLIFKPDADISQDVKVINDEFLLVSTIQDLEVFQIMDPTRPDGLKPLKSLVAPTSGLKNIRASNVDNYNRLWVATNGGLYTTDNFFEVVSGNNGNNESDSLVLIENLPALECNYLKKDDAGNLWAGCINGLIKITPDEEAPVKEYKIFKNQDGLLDDDIIHLDIDNSTGTVWVVTDKGLNRFESGGVVPLNKLTSVDVYPNPFLGKHDFVVFTKLTPKAKVFIMNQAGNIIFESNPSLIKGGQLKWKGENKAGRKASPGVYFYSIIDKSKVIKGKLIIAR